MILLRISKGIGQHFPQRVSEWIMGGLLLFYTAAISVDESAFDGPSFSVLLSLADRETWALICMVVGLVRMAALVINGSFHNFRHAPHLRAFASAGAGIFWGQIVLGLVVAVIWQDGRLHVVAVYMTFMTFELWNFFRASADVGASRRQRKHVRHL